MQPQDDGSYIAPGELLPLAEASPNLERRDS
jgi:hypothetical protein